jgi:hypothetical protein
MALILYKASRTLLLKGVPNWTRIPIDQNAIRCFSMRLALSTVAVTTLVRVDAQTVFLVPLAILLTMSLSVLRRANKRYEHS